MGSIDYFKPKWQLANFILKTAHVVLFLLILSSLNWADGYEKIAKLCPKSKAGDKKACAKLAKIAGSNGFDLMRRDAVECITDQAVLAKLVMDDSVYVRDAAMKKLTDQVLLAKIANSEGKNRIYDIRVEAVIKLTDQALLADVAKKTKVWKVRKEAVKKLTDQSLLSEIAMNDKDMQFYALLNPNLPDQVREEIAKNHESEYRRKTAVETLSNKTILTEIAKNDKSYIVRLAALKNVGLGSARYVSVREPLPKAFSSNSLWGKVLLAKIGLSVVKEPKNADLRISFIADTEAIKADYFNLGTCYSGATAHVTLILEDYNIEIKESHRIDPPDELTSDSDYYNRLENAPTSEAAKVALEKVMSRFASSFIKEDRQPFIFEIAKNDEIKTVRSVAADMLTDQTLLAEILKNGKEPERRMVYKLTDYALIADVVKNSKYGYIRKIAEERLKEFKKN